MFNNHKGFSLHKRRGGKAGPGVPYRNDLLFSSGTGDFTVLQNTETNFWEIENQIGDRNGVQHEGLTVTANGTDNYLDTNYAPNGNTVWIIQGKYSSVGGTNRMGSIDSTNNRRLYFGSINGTTFGFGCGLDSANTTIPVDTELHTFIMCSCGKFWILDGIVDISTISKIRNILDNITPIASLTPFTGTSNTSLSFAASAVNGGTPAFFANFEHFSSQILEYDEISDPVLKQAYVFESDDQNEFELLNSGILSWMGATGYRTSNINKKIWNGVTLGAFIDQYGYSIVTYIVPPKINGDLTFSTTLNAIGFPLENVGLIKRNIQINNSSIGNFNGTDNYLSFSNLTGITITSFIGTSTPTIVGNNIEFTAGTALYLELSDGSIFQFSETSGNTIFDVSGSNNHCTIEGVITNFWSNSDIQKPYNFINGYNDGGIVDNELVTDGTFDNGLDDWAVSGDWTAENNIASIDGSQTATATLIQSIVSIETGKAYLFELDAIVTSGICQVKLGGSSTTVLATGFNSVVIRNQTVSNLQIRAIVGFIGSVANISLKEYYPETVKIPSINDTVDAIGNPLLIQGLRLNNSENTYDFSCGIDSPYLAQISIGQDYDLTAYEQGDALYNPIYSRIYEDWAYTCLSSGQMYTELTQTYKLFEFGFNKSADANILSFILSDVNDLTGDNSYILSIRSTESILFARRDSGVTTSLFTTSANYIDVDTDYSIKIARNSVENEFFMGAIGTWGILIKGGVFTEYQLISVITGSNPIEDNTHTSFTYLNIDADTGDAISDVRVNNYDLNPISWVGNSGSFEHSNEYQDRITIYNAIRTSTEDAKVRKYTKPVGDDIQPTHIPKYVDDSSGGEEIFMVDDGSGGEMEFNVINTD